jgi:hypothetical protein
VGGAFLDFLIRRSGVETFVWLSNGSREGRFGAAGREVYGVELQAPEAESWGDVRKLAGGGSLCHWSRRREMMRESRGRATCRRSP